MGIGAITISSANAPAAPDRLGVRLQSGNSIGQYGFREKWRTVKVAGKRALLMTNGRAPMLHALKGTLLRTGLLAPPSACAVTFSGSGAQAGATLTLASQPVDTSYIVLVSAGDQVNYEWRVYFVTSFYTEGDYLKYWQVKRGASAAALLDNLKAAINGTGTDGNEYRSPTIQPGIQTADHPASWADWVTAGTNTDTTQAFTALQFGTGGNAYEARHDGTAAYTSFGSSSKFSGGTAGTGTDPLRGVYHLAYAFGRSADGAYSAVSPTVSIETLDAGNLNISSLSSGLGAQFESVDVKRWFRTVNTGQSDRLFRGYDVANADTTDTDDLSNVALALRGLYNPAIHRPYAAGYVPRYRHCAEYNGSVFGAGFLPSMEYTVGTVTATTGSREVTFAGLAQPTAMWEGRQFRETTSALTEATTYTVIHVNETAKTAQLDRAFEGGGGSGLSYAVRDVRDHYEVGRSAPLLLNNWPTGNTIQSVVSASPDGVTALFGAFESIIAATSTSLWRIQGEGVGPIPYRVKNAYEGVGVVGAHLAVMVEGAAFFLGSDGIYRWFGDGAPEKVSSPPVTGGTPTGIKDTIDRINRVAAAAGFAHYDPKSRVARFFVPLDTDITCRYAIVLDLQTSTWSLDFYGIDVTYAATLAMKDGTLWTVCGDIQGNLWQMDVGESDGAYQEVGASAWGAVNAITSSTRGSATCSGASFPTAGHGLKGVPVVLVDASGNFTYNTIASNTGTVLTFARLMATAPTGTLIVGGIHMRLTTGKFTMGQADTEKALAHLRVCFSPISSGQAWVSCAGDQDDPAVTSGGEIDLSKTDGEELVSPLVRGKMLQMQLDVVTPGIAPAFTVMRPDIRSKRPFDV
jgi:hypothetical protein